MSETSSKNDTTPAEDITELVRQRYASAATRVLEGAAGCGCGSGACCGTGIGEGTAITADSYTADDVAALPEEAVLASLGCGNPTALIDLREGEHVLDLGSGGGIDVLLSAKRVGPTGYVLATDISPKILEFAALSLAAS